MSASSEKWIDRLQFSSLFWTPPRDGQQRQAQIMAYVEFFGQFTSEQFPEDVAQLIHNNYPSKERRLLDEVLAIFVLHHPEHGHAVVHPILSCIIDGTLVYDKNEPPFSSFISLVGQKTEVQGRGLLGTWTIFHVCYILFYTMFVVKAKFYSVALNLFVKVE